MISECNSILLFVGWSTISSRYASWKWFIRQGNPRYLTSSPSNSYTGHTSTAILAKSRQGTSWKPEHMFLQLFVSSTSNSLLRRTFHRLHFLPSPVPPFLFFFLIMHHILLVVAVAILWLLPAFYFVIYFISHLFHLYSSLFQEF